VREEEERGREKEGEERNVTNSGSCYSERLTDEENADKRASTRR
jgi:hypothetical protein